MLSPPTQPILAVSREQWKEYHDSQKVIHVPAGDPDGQEIQVWSYPP